MKKKILGLIFAFCLIIPCAVVFTACDDKPEPIMHSVTFVYDNGTENNTIEVEEGKYATKPTDPSKYGYAFDGWYVDDFKWNFELVAVMKDTTLTAKWIETPTYCSVKFMVDGEQYGETQSVEIRSNVLCPETNPIKTGYTFNGWEYDNKIIFNANGEKINDVEIADEMIFQAIFVANNYNLLINYYISGTTTPISTSHTSSVAYDSEYSVISPSIVGYSPDTITVSGTMDNIQGKTINVYYTPLSCEITFDFNGGANGTTSVVAIFDADMPEITLPSRVGYNFVGYFDAETDGTKYYNADGTSAETWNKTDNATLFARWELKDCQLKISYYIKDIESQICAPYITTIKYGETFSVNNPKVSEYKYPIGIDEQRVDVATNEIVYTTEKVTGKMNDENGLEITVRYEPKTYTVTTNYYYYGTTDKIADTKTTTYAYPYPYGVEIKRITGYEAKNETESYQEKDADGDVIKIVCNVYYVIKQDCQLTIKYYKYDTTEEIAETYTNEIPFQTTYEVESPTVAGYTPQTSKVSGKMDKDEKEIKVYYTPNTNTPYTLAYYIENPNDDDFTKDNTLTENFTGTTDTQISIKKANLKTFEHFTFLADKSTLSGTIAGDGSLELKAYYKREILTVTFDGDGKTLVSGSETQTVKYGGNAIPPRYLGYSNGSLNGTISKYNIGDITNVTENKTNIQPSGYAPYVIIDELGTEDANGNYILYGAYPQTDVTESMKDKLTQQTELPVYIQDFGWNNNGWTNYGYGSLMWYKDINYTDGMKYRAVYFKQYRPKDATNIACTIPDFTNQAENGYYIENIYIFRFEPVKWRILTSSDGKLTLLSNIILDSQNFDDNPSNNNYSSSSIRSWLNSHFLNSFLQTDIQKSLLNEVNIDGNNDKVWLLSYEEATNVDYGFVNTFDSDPLRTRLVTDYAKMEGAYNYNYGGGTVYTGSWWLRTGEQGRNDVKYVVSTGEILRTSPESTYIGVVPAIKITLS